MTATQRGWLIGAGIVLAALLVMEDFRILAIVAAAAGLYVAPTVVAYRRGVSHRMSVAVVNVLLGWTLIGWAAALAWAVRDVEPR